MAKRFTDTEKWKDEWFLSLDNDSRMIWQYILDNCSFAGIFKKNYKLLNFCCNTNITESDFKRIFDGRVVDLGNTFFIPKFLKFQYPKGLNSNKPVIVSVVNQLRENNLLTIINKSFGNDYLIIKDKDKDKEKDKDKDKDKDKEKDKTAVSGKFTASKAKKYFENVWQMYPRKEGRKAAERCFSSSVKTEQDYTDLVKAIQNYCRLNERTELKFIKHGSAFFNNWRDYINPDVINLNTLKNGNSNTLKLNGSSKPGQDPYIASKLSGRTLY